MKNKRLLFHLVTLNAFPISGQAVSDPVMDHDDRLPFLTSYTDFHSSTEKQRDKHFWVH